MRACDQVIGYRCPRLVHNLTHLILHLYRKGQMLESNAQAVQQQAVQQIVRISNELERPIASPAQTREVLGLSASPADIRALLEGPGR